MFRLRIRYGVGGSGSGSRYRQDKKVSKKGKTEEISCFKSSPEGWRLLLAGAERPLLRYGFRIFLPFSNFRQKKLGLDPNANSVPGTVNLD